MKGFLSTIVPALILLFNFIALDKVEIENKFELKVSYIGNSDKPLPTLIFSNSSKEHFKLFNYYYQLNYYSYCSIIKDLNIDEFKSKNKESLIKIVDNNKKIYYLNKQRALTFFLKLMSITDYKRNKQLTNQLNFYSLALKQ